MDMKSLSALRFNTSALDLNLSESPRRRRDIKVSRRDSGETNSPDIKQMKDETDSPSSSTSSLSSSSSSHSSSSPSSPNSPQNAILPPPLLPLAGLTDPPPLIPLLSSFGRFGHPGGTPFLPFAHPANGNSFMPFHHPASVFFRQQQAALAYSYALMNAQQQQIMRQQKQFNKDRSAIFRPHELPDHHHHHHPHRLLQPSGISSSTERPFYHPLSSKIVPIDGNDLRLNLKREFQENLSDLLPVDLRKTSTSNDDSTRYINQQQQQTMVVHATQKKNTTSGKKLIGIRFLFPPFSDHVTLHERAKIWVARHEYKYFVDWSADDLLKVDLELRPIQPITRQQYKIHMNRSEFCRNVKLKFCLQTDSPWARDFCEKLQKSPADGGFTGLCQAKIAAADLWRTYSENYRSHQARQPNGASIKPTGAPKIPSAKKRTLAADDSPSKKCTKLDNKSTIKSGDSIDPDSLLDYTKLRNNSYYYYYYRQYNNDLKLQINRDYLNERRSTNQEKGGRNSSPGRCLVQTSGQWNRSKFPDRDINEDERKESDEDDGGDDDDDNNDGGKKSSEIIKTNNSLQQSPSIWKPFLKASPKHHGDIERHPNDVRGIKSDRFVVAENDDNDEEMNVDSKKWINKDGHIFQNGVRDSSKFDVRFPTTEKIVSRADGITIHHPLINTNNNNISNNNNTNNSNNKNKNNNFLHNTSGTCRNYFSSKIPEVSGNENSGDVVTFQRKLMRNFNRPDINNNIFVHGEVKRSNINNNNNSNNIVNNKDDDDDDDDNDDDENDDDEKSCLPTRNVQICGIIKKSFKATCDLERPKDIQRSDQSARVKSSNVTDYFNQNEDTNPKTRQRFDHNIILLDKIRSGHLREPINGLEIESSETRTSDRHEIKHHGHVLQDICKYNQQFQCKQVSSQVSNSRPFDCSSLSSNLESDNEVDVVDVEEFDK